MWVSLEQQPSDCTPSFYGTKISQMTLEELGYGSEWEQHRSSLGLEDLDVGRVVSEHKERYMVKTAEGEGIAEIMGNLRFSALSRSDFPAVGDWVAVSPYDQDKLLIHHILPRKTIIERQAVGRQAEKQIIATNVDAALIIQSADRDFNLNRLQRYLTICYVSHVQPTIVLNKIDLVDALELKELVSQISGRVKEVDILTVSNETQAGIDALKARIRPGQTFCLLGSSGVGKSSLLNSLVGKVMMKTSAISDSVSKGRHTTSHRELIVLPNGGIIIDNPGMREVGIADSDEGLEWTFADIEELAIACKYKDCRHLNEIGCAVLAAIEREEIGQELYENYLKMRRETEHFEASVAERRKKDKERGKMIKQILKGKNSRKY